MLFFGRVNVRPKPYINGDLEHKLEKPACSNHEENLCPLDLLVFDSFPNKKMLRTTYYYTQLIYACDWMYMKCDTTELIRNFVLNHHITSRDIDLQDFIQYGMREYHIDALLECGWDPNKTRLCFVKQTCAYRTSSELVMFIALVNYKKYGGNCMVYINILLVILKHHGDLNRVDKKLRLEFEQTFYGSEWFEIYMKYFQTQFGITCLSCDFLFYGLFNFAGKVPRFRCTNCKRVLCSKCSSSSGALLSLESLIYCTLPVMQYGTCPICIKLDRKTIPKNFVWSPKTHHLCGQKVTKMVIFLFMMHNRGDKNLFGTISKEILFMIINFSINF